MPLETDFTTANPRTTTRRSGRRSRTRITHIGPNTPPPAYSSSNHFMPPAYSPPIKPSAPPLSPPIKPSAPLMSSSNYASNEMINTHIKKNVVPKLYPGEHPYNPLFTQSPPSNILNHPQYPRIQEALGEIMRDENRKKGLYAFKIPGSLDYYFANKLSNKQMGTVYKLPTEYYNLVKSGNNEFLGKTIKYIDNNKTAKKLQNLYKRTLKTSILRKSAATGKKIRYNKT